jgi:alkylated DNA repair dioxygenase AlkB
MILNQEELDYISSLFYDEEHEEHEEQVVGISLGAPREFVRYKEETYIFNKINLPEE